MKKLIKTIFPLMLVFIVSLAFTACGDDKKQHSITLGQSVNIEGYEIAVDDTFTPINASKLGDNAATAGKTLVGIQVKIKVSANSKSTYVKYSDASGASNVVIKLEYNDTVYNADLTSSHDLYTEYKHGDDTVLSDLVADKQYNLPFAFEVPADGFDMNKAYIYVETETAIYRFTLSA